MKKILMVLVVVLCCSASTFGQKVPYKVVFDVTSSDTVVHRMLIRWVTGIAASDPEAQIEIVYYGKSLGMITKGKSSVENEVIGLAAKKNVKFNVCEVALKNNSVEKSQLLEGIGVVPDGIYEIIQRQYEGWGYIKASR